MDFECAKASRINDHKSVNINNMDPFVIIDLKDFSTVKKSIFEYGKSEKDSFNFFRNIS